MADLKAILLNLQEHRKTLLVRAAKQAGNTSLKLNHQIKDHDTAIDLTIQAISGQLNQTVWEKEMQSLLISDTLRPERTSKIAVAPPFMVEGLPVDFIPRPGEMEPLVARLLNEQPEGPTAITTALRGAGGYGKTTLAKAICHDKRIRRIFSDGILWVTLGERPNVVGGVVKIYAQLTDQRPAFIDWEDAANSLAEALAEKRCLLVVDDVWHQSHLRPFLRGGPNCTRLVTTRDSSTLPLNSEQINVDAMRQHEAVALLGAGLEVILSLPLPEGKEPNTSLPLGRIEGELIALTTRLGEWPLLLKLANGVLRNRLQRGQTLSEAFDYLDRALDKKGLTAFDARQSEDRSQVVARTLGVSFELLDEEEYARYQELALFPEDVDVPVALLEKLWAATGDLDEIDAEALCDRLAQLSLLADLNLTTHTLRLHDVIRTYLIDQYDADNLQSLHSFFLDLHQPTEPSPLLPNPTSIIQDTKSLTWADLSPTDAYLWTHLLYHLLAAGRGEELVETVKELRYLVLKTHLFNPYSAELDLMAATAYDSNDDSLNRLSRNFIQNSHIFNRCESIPDLVVAVHSRLQHIEAIQIEVQQLAQLRPATRIEATYPLPDLPHPALVRTLSGHSDKVMDCTISKDGQKIVSASEDGTLKIWDMEGGKELLTLVWSQS